MATVYLIRWADTSGRMNPERRWVLFDEVRSMTGKAGESKELLIDRWEHDHGKITDLHRYKGAMRQSEVAMTIGEVRAISRQAERVAPVEDDPKFQAAFTAVIAYAKDSGQDVATVLERMAKIEMVR